MTTDAQDRKRNTTAKDNGSTPKPDGPASSRKAPANRHILKAVAILACAALALKQVALLIDEYQSFPTNTLYAIEDAGKVRLPAFTFCPKPSASAPLPSSDYPWEIEAFMNDSTFWRKFEDVAVSLESILYDRHYMPFSKLGNESTVNGETIITLPNATGHWSVRTFPRMTRDDTLGGHRYFKCFTLHLKEERFTGTTNCWANIFELHLPEITDSTEPMIEIHIHEAAEDFTMLQIFEPEQAVVFNNSITRLYIRSEVIEKQTRKNDPCILDENYSYYRCAENCFWEKIQANSTLPCLYPSLLTREANLTKPKCEDWREERSQIKFLQNAFFAFSRSQILDECGCPKKCNTTVYRVSAAPRTMCPGELRILQRGVGVLTFRFPRQVPHFIEKERVTLLDLLSNIGGIVGICLGASLLTLLDIVEQACARIHRKLFPRKNEVMNLDGR